jgi:hypothetical protein
MLERTEDRFGLKPGYLAADSAYGSAASLAWLVKQKKITPHIPVFDKSTRTDGSFRAPNSLSRPKGTDIPVRPAKSWSSSGAPTLPADRHHRRRHTPLSRQQDCDVCELKLRCCPNAVARNIPRDLHEDGRDVARALAATPEHGTACRRRKKS